VISPRDGFALKQDSAFGSLLVVEIWVVRREIDALSAVSTDPFQSFSLVNSPQACLLRLVGRSCG